MTGIYDYSFDMNDGSEISMSQHQGKALLIVNTASKCGLTPQFEGLENLYKKFADKGLVIIGFPCNQFGNQDPGSDAEIMEFCQLNYGVSFPMAAKIDVNGNETHPIFQFLKKAAPGLLGSEKIKWNFTKFLVNQDGDVVDRFAPATTPEKLEQAIGKLLG